MEIRVVTVLSLAALFCLLLIDTASGGEDLYRELGVSRSAGTREIRTAFRRLAKEWHPDKNKSPSAQEKFMKLNQAYEILSDDEKRHKYDLTGEIGDSPQARQPFTGQGFTVFQSGNTFQFRFNMGSRSQRRDGVTTTSFFEDVLPNSHHRPYLLNFYHDFCFQCGQVENIWNQLKRDLEPLGVGLGSVHANYHLRVTQYCSVSRVPSVVGVVSGRVIHFHGQIRGKKTFIDFLEEILPNDIVLPLTETNVDSFLSDALPRNKPRLVLFTLDLSPTLSHKLTAFMNQKTVDVGHVSTHPQRQVRAVMNRFRVYVGERQLAHLYKEDYRPTQVLEEADMEGERLKVLLETAVLYLPRLSSQKWLNRICPLDSPNRLCVVLLVQDISSYNDSITSSFREQAKKGVYNYHSPDQPVGFAYLDRTKQTKFIESFNPPASNLRVCPGGDQARPVLLLRRLSSKSVQFYWYVKFCGESNDVMILENFLSAFTLNKMEHTVTVPELVDENAPGWLRQWLDDVLHSYYDIYDYLLAIDPQVLTPTVTLLCATILLCIVGVFAGGPQESEENQTNRARQARGSPRQGPSHQQSPTQIYPLDQRTYTELVQHGPRGQITMILLVNSSEKEQNRTIAQSFWKTASKYLTRKVYVCYVCYRGRKHWLGSLLKSCSEMMSNEIEARVNCCDGGRVATVVVLFGSRKQFSIFPESISNFTESSENTSNVVCNGTIAPSHSELRNRTADTSQKSVGHILGDTLGFEEQEEEEEAKEKKRYKSEERRHSTDNNHSKAQRNAESVDEQSSSSSSKSDKSDPRVVQLSSQLEVWMERLADGSLRRYNLEEWPQWSDLIQQ